MLRFRDRGGLGGARKEVNQRCRQTRWRENVRRGGRRRLQRSLRFQADGAALSKV